MSEGAVSIVVPVYNDPDGLQTTVDSLVATGIDSLIVIDNGSIDRTPQVGSHLQAAYEVVTIKSEPDIQSSYAARNTGIRNTDADILAFVDADMTVPEDWLESALHEFQATNADYMGCNVELTLPENPTLAAHYDHHTGFPVQQYIEHQHFAPTCCLFVRREVFADVGLFDHRLTSAGDKEFGNRVREAGYDLHFAEDVTMSHPTRNSIRDLVAKDRRVGRGLCQLQRYHPERYGTPGVPPRPTGVKRPDRDLPARDRLAFGALSRALTGVRGVGYYQEYLAGERRGDLEDDIPRLEE